jgi:transposase
MPLPEWVVSQKKQGFEIKKIGNGYYMYERKSRWDKKRQKSVKVTGKYIGVVTPDGIIPRKKRLDKTKPVFSLEYGATAFIKFIATDILEMLSKHFGERTAQSIWAVSMLRLISPSPFRRVEEHYHTSWMSMVLPNLPLSKSSITNLIDHVGNNRAGCAAFMRDMLQPAPYLLIDGSRVTSKSEGILRALPGHNSNNKYLPQINQIYIATVSESGDSMPGFYRNVSGNTPDISAFELTLEDAGVKEGIVLADNGFASAVNFEELEDPQRHLKYIVPLKRNTKETDLAKIKFEEYFSYHNRGISAHTEDKGGYRVYTFRDAFMYAKEFSASICRAENANATAMTKRNFDPDKDLRNVSAKTKEIENNFGTIVLRTNILDKSASYIYHTYKIRWEIELLFKTLRNTCDQDASYMRDDAGFEAWSFFAHITISVACRILAKLREMNMLNKWSLEGLLDHLSRIHIVKIEDEWRIAEITKKTRELVESLGFNLEIN